MALLIVSAATLTTGLMLVALGRSELANAAWTAGSLPVLIALLISIVKSLRRHEAGVDVLALVAVGFALALSEFLTAAVISLMLSSGRALEDYARERARRELTALMSRAPRFANRFEDGEWRCV
ncbi:heavy metal translocating P-type ATPase [Caballeronia terrestris]|uniref:Heavy metal translocating P-type ATPase n=3 Tax=Caballeronia TaxID=1827195 RepID=A0A158L5T2_9BURK|nr:heavy metal translocating P-type ATPase [Caballeronia humi]SAL88240.1 heavy metal translocating P-type ATPase [Caballeronia terrestris]